MMKRRAGIALMAFLAGAVPAAATGTIECASPEGETSVELAIGTLPILSVLRATIRSDDGHWSTEEVDGETIAVGQQFRDAEGIRVDFTDPNVEGVIAELRLVEATEGRHHAMAGALRIEGVGAFALICTGP